MARHPSPVLLAGVCAVALIGLWRFAQRADAFLIAHVRVSPHSSLKPPPSLVGSNLWQVDLRGLAEQLHSQQPWLKQVRVVRQLPNTLWIQPVERVPVAQVQASQWHPVDEEGVMLPDASPEPIDGLIRLAGVGPLTPTTRDRQGETEEPLRLALRVVRLLQRSPVLVSRRLLEVNVADPQQIRFIIDLSLSSSSRVGVLAGAEDMAGRAEVRCGSEAELETNLARLRAALRTLRQGAVPIRYVDVRFPEPVVGPQ